ncbi:sugar transferase [bacterium]|nr:sugar transferase [bacterium]
MARVAPEDGAHPAEDLRGDASEFDLSIIIVGYNSAEPLRECLRSLEGCGDRLARETILIDNASADDTVDMVRREFPGVAVYQNGANVGLARAVNRGIRESVGRYVLVLNPDIEVRSGALDELVAFMDATPGAGLAGSKLINEDASLQLSCRSFYTFWTLLLRRTFLGKVFRQSRAIRRHLMLDYDHEDPSEVDWVLGACMIVRRSAMADVGPMDERFFLYFEDVDWCYRMWRGGWKVWYVPASTMNHRHARESARPGVNKLLVAHLLSLLHFYEKWGGVIYRMKKHRRILLTVFNLTADLIAVNGGFVLAYALRSSLRGFLTKPLFEVGTYGTFIVFANIIFILAFAFFGLYSGHRVRETGADLILRVTRSAVVAGVVLMASTFLTLSTVYSRLLVGAFCVLVVLLDVALRGFLRWLQLQARAGSFDLTRVVIVGTGATAGLLAERIAAAPELGYDLAGFVDEKHSGETRASRDSAVPVIGRLAELPELIERHRIEEVIFAEPELSSTDIADFLLSARRSTVDVKMVSDLTNLLTQRARVEEFLDVPVVSFEREALLGAQALVKRGLDLGAAAILLLFSSPVLAAAVLAAGMGARRSLFEGSERAGLDEQPFRMWRLREQPKKGALRRYAERHGLSQVPQLLNVFTGKMSLVGPAPLSPADARACGPRALIRFDARPGVTGLAQVAAAAHRVNDGGGALDAYYVQNWSLGGDLRIVMRWGLLCLAGRCVPRRLDRPS